MDDARTPEIALLKTSELFDPDWYLATYDIDLPDGVEPEAHYLQSGAAARYDPGPHFSSGFYLDTHPKLERAGGNPLLHYLKSQRRAVPPPPADYRRVLWAAAGLAARGAKTQALALAEECLPETLTHTVDLLRASILAESDAESGLWEDSFNRYLRGAGFPVVEMLPTTGAGPVSRFSRLRGAGIAPAVVEGPLVSVLMPVWNAKETVETAVKSILAQSWRAIELLIVDDVSTDGTFDILQRLARQDARITLLRNICNVGPYASKNRALLQAKGQFVTGHDADEWAHPLRIEQHVAAARDLDTACVSSVQMIRMTPEGQFPQLRQIGPASPDGVQQHCPCATLFARDFLQNRLGSWHCARFGADTELISRARYLLGRAPAKLSVLANISLDLEGSLTNNPLFGIHPAYGVTPGRKTYRDAWQAWHAVSLTPERAYYPFPPEIQPFDVPAIATVPLADIQANAAAT